MIRGLRLLLLALLPAALLSACGSGDQASRATLPTAAPAAAGNIPSPSPPPLSGELTVFAAASLTDAFNEIAGAFQTAHPRVTVRYNFGASSTLRTQLEQGARADVFASADQVQMDAAKKANVIDGEAQLFAKNKLTVIVPADNPAKIGGVQDLARPGIRFVLTDKSVPIGNYARTALEKMAGDPRFGADFAQKVLANLKSEEANVRAVVTKVQLGEADAAIVYSSDVTPTVAKEVQRITIPDEFNIIATYPIAVVRDAPNKPAARAFVQFVRGPQGQDILNKWGFIVDAETRSGRAPHINPTLPLLTVAQERRYSPSFRLTGGVERPAAYTLSDLQTLPAEEVEVDFLTGTGMQHHRYRGVRLSTLILQAGPLFDPNVRNDALHWYVRVDATDGYWAILAWAEMDPGFANKPVLVAYEEDGALLGEMDGMARLVVPGDLRGGRYVSNIRTITLVKAEPPAPHEPDDAHASGWRNEE